MKHLFQIPVDFSALSVDEIRQFIASAGETAAAVGADPESFVTDDRDLNTLLSEMQEGVEAIETAKAELASRDTAATEDDETDDEPEAAEDEPETATAADVAALAQAAADAAAVEEPEIEETEPVAPVEPVTAAAPPARRRLAAPARSRRHEPPSTETQRVALTAAAANIGPDLGEPFADEIELARAMTTKRHQFGTVSPGTHGEKVPIAKADWSLLYTDDRRLVAGDFAVNQERIDAVVDHKTIRANFEARKRQALVAAGDPVKERSLTASGGLCAPVTPYYDLAMVSTASRPVRAGLPVFNADRGGIRFARPATLATITTGVGRRTAAADFAGGTEGVKTCQSVSCPPFDEVDVATIFHCLQFGNLGARTFPERVAQWNNLTLAAHARLAETALLDGIDDASTQVTAASMGLGATGDLLGQFLAAASGMRSRHRMDDRAILRLMLPAWSVDMMVSDVIRSQFERFDTDEAKLTALLRSFDLEPSFYIDGSTGDGQVFAAQTAAGLLEFPSTVKWFLFPEGSFIYLDGGTLELGLVRDSDLNATNDFQIFGETFENVAFIGVESLAVVSTTCDNGVVSAPHATSCPSY